MDSMKHNLVQSIPLSLLPILTAATSAYAVNINIPQPSTTVSNIGVLISSGITAAIVISGLLTFLYLVWGGLEWLTSGGDKAKYEAARGRITAAIIGLAIVAAAWAIMQLIAQFFGISLTNISFPNATGNGTQAPS